MANCLMQALHTASTKSNLQEALPCPYNTRYCRWYGTLSLLVEHWHIKHEQYVQKGNQLFMQRTNKRRNFLLVDNEEMFIIKYRYTREKNVSLEVNCIHEKCNCEKNYKLVFYCDGEPGRDSDYIIRRGKDTNMCPDNTITFFHPNKPSEEDFWPNCQISITIKRDQCVILPLKELCELAITNGTKQNNTASNLQLLLECPVCYEQMSSPIYQCTNGHSLCSECSGKIKNCPMCNVYMKFKIRNLVAEKLSEEILNECDFCDYAGLSSDVKEHQKMCLLRDLTCPFDHCNWEGQFDDASEHIWDNHCTRVLVKENNVFKLTSNVQMYIMFVDECALLVLQTFKDNNFMFMVRKFGPLTDKSEYSFTLVFTSRDEKERISYKFRCDPFVTDLTDPFEGNLLKIRSLVKIPIQLLKPFKKDGAYPYTLCIHKC